MGMPTMGMEAIAGKCQQQVNLEVLCNVWKPAHPWLAPCWNGHVLTLMTTAMQGGRSARATWACVLRRIFFFLKKHCFLHFEFSTFVLEYVLV